MMPAARRDSCVLVLSPDCKETGGSNRGVKAAQAAITERLKIRNPTARQTKQLKARRIVIEAPFCILQTAKETLKKYCKVRIVWNDTNNSKVSMHDEIKG